MFPTLDEVRAYAAEGRYRRVPVRMELLADRVGYFSYDYVKYAEPRLREGELADRDFRDVDLMLFAGLPERFNVARYHSLAADEATPPARLRVTARTDDGEVIAVEDAAARVFGVQFHPESVMTPDGAAIIANFLTLV